MARFTQCYTITEFKSKFWILSKMFKMMCIQIPSFIVATILASEIITKKYIKAPSFIISTESLITPFTQFPIFIGMATRTFCSINPKYFTNFFACFNSMLLPIHWGFIPLSLFRQQFFCCLGMVLPFKCTNSTLVRFMRSINTNTKMTLCRQTISTTIINIKVVLRTPLSAFCAPLFCDDSSNIFFNRNTYSLCCNLLNTYIITHNLWLLN